MTESTAAASLVPLIPIQSLTKKKDPNESIDIDNAKVQFSGIDPNRAGVWLRPWSQAPRPSVSEGVAPMRAVTNQQVRKYATKEREIPQLAVGAAVEESPAAAAVATAAVDSTEAAADGKEKRSSRGKRKKTETFHIQMGSQTARPSKSAGPFSPAQRERLMQLLPAAYQQPDLASLDHIRPLDSRPQIVQRLEKFISDELFKARIKAKKHQLRKSSSTGSLPIKSAASATAEEKQQQNETVQKPQDSLDLLDFELRTTYREVPLQERLAIVRQAAQQLAENTRLTFGPLVKLLMTTYEEQIDALLQQIEEAKQRRTASSSVYTQLKKDREKAEDEFQQKIKEQKEKYEKLLSEYFEIQYDKDQMEKERKDMAVKLHQKEVESAEQRKNALFLARSLQSCRATCDAQARRIEDLEAQEYQLQTLRKEQLVLLRKIEDSVPKKDLDSSKRKLEKLQQIADWTRSQLKLLQRAHGIPQEIQELIGNIIESQHIIGEQHREFLHLDVDHEVLTSPRPTRAADGVPILTVSQAKKPEAGAAQSQLTPLRRSVKFVRLGSSIDLKSSVNGT